MDIGMDIGMDVDRKMKVIPDVPVGVGVDNIKDILIDMDSVVHHSPH